MTVLAWFELDNVRAKHVQLLCKRYLANTFSLSIVMNVRKSPMVIMQSQAMRKQICKKMQGGRNGSVFCTVY